MRTTSFGFAYSEEGIESILAMNGLGPDGARAWIEATARILNLPAVVDFENVVWVLLPSGRVARQVSGVEPQWVHVLSGPAANRRFCEGFPATSLRGYLIQDVALLEGTG